MSTVDWTSGLPTGLVAIGTHALYLSASGSRRPGDPAIIVVTGCASTTSGWAAVRRLVDPFARIYLYDRSGLGRSEESPDLPTSTVIATELDRLLVAARIDPPYVLVGHSWGGILAREFLHQKVDDVAGMVLVDTASENSFNILLMDDPDIAAVFKDVDYDEITGVNAKQKLTPAEWDAMMHSSSAEHQAEQEQAQIVPSAKRLAEKKQLNRDPPFLGSRPLAVVMGNEAADWQAMYAAGVAKGNGTEEQRAQVAAKLLDGAEARLGAIHREELSLSSRTSFIRANCGHNVQLMEPELIADRIRWVLDEVRRTADV